MRRVIHALATGATYAAMTLAVAAGVVAVLVATDRIRLARVLTGSMRPTIPVGALVAGVPTERVEVGDVVMFRPPAPYADADGTPVAHRVIAVSTQDGRRLVSTSGDANAAPDPWQLDAAGTTFYRVAGDSLLAGRLTVAIDPGNPRTAANFVMVPAWLVTLRLIWNGREGSDPAPERRRGPGRHRAPRGCRRARQVSV